MGIFSPARNVDDPKQLSIAAHEIGHGIVWKAGGCSLRGPIRFYGDGGDCPVRYWPNNERQLIAFAVGLWAGYEAERLWWKREGGRGHASRGNSSHDISLFRQHIREFPEIRMSEGKARRLAREQVKRHWSQIA